jgi:hypothetical protein
MFFSWSVINDREFFCTGCDLTGVCCTGEAAAKGSESMAHSVYFMRVPLPSAISGRCGRFERDPKIPKALIAKPSWTAILAGWKKLRR